MTQRIDRGRADLVADHSLLGDWPPGESARRDILASILGLPDAAIAEIPDATAELLVDRLVAMSARLRRLEAEAALDELTGVLRRGVGMRLLQAEVDRVHRSNGHLTLAFVDVNGLKRVNDNDGHAAGDSLLQAVARTLRRRLRSYDLVVRWGGDEFLCVLSGATLDEARAKLTLIGAELHQHMGRPAISVGLATLAPEPEADDDAMALVGRADADLYAARQVQRLAR
ncbi:MAG TPA: GGDEF domain-containing protein [Candidatus Dormibacteraeota bacterium]|nr:GGDEF domain-containing protein [Candidatus Dormibacteraeota bacterium]